MSFNSVVVSVMQDLGIEFPGGDSDTLNNIATSWETMAGDLDTVGHALDKAVSSMPATEWSGSAHDAFVAQWKNQYAAMKTGSQNFRQVAASLRTYAKQIESINEELVSICEQIMAASVAGALLSIVTAGISDAVAAAADGAEAGRITELVVEFANFARDAAESIKDFLGISDELASVLGDLALTFAKNFGADAGSDVLSQLVSGQKVTLGHDLEDGAVDALGTTVFDGAMPEGMNTTLKNTLGNMYGTLMQDSLVDHDSPSTLAENLFEASITGALGSSNAKPSGETVENLTLYTDGDVLEGGATGMSGKIRSILGSQYISGGDQMPSTEPEISA